MGSPGGIRSPVFPQVSERRAYLKLVIELELELERELVGSQPQNRINTHDVDG